MRGEARGAGGGRAGGRKAGPWRAHVCVCVHVRAACMRACVLRAACVRAPCASCAVGACMRACMRWPCVRPYVHACVLKSVVKTALSLRTGARWCEMRGMRGQAAAGGQAGGGEVEG